MAVWIDEKRVLEHKGKTIKYGATVPADLPKESYDKFVKAGSIASSLPTIPEQKDLVAELKGRIEGLVADKQIADKQIADLTIANDKLTVALANADKQIADLTEQIMKPVTTEGVAGPGKGKK